MRKITEGLNDELFKDFTFRFSEAIRNNEEIFTIEDYLSLTRKIFLSYYEECNMEVPNYFPRQIFRDYLEKQVGAWRDLFYANRNCFIVKGDEIQVNIDEIFRNSIKVEKQKEKLLNFLDETCIARDSYVGVNWFLRKNEFYRFINYQPTFIENFKGTIQKFLPN